jgi:uncharacterized protein YhaN
MKMDQEMESILEKLVLNGEEIYKEERKSLLSMTSLFEQRQALKDEQIKLLKYRKENVSLILIIEK